jgi:hypothetical protein
MKPGPADVEHDPLAHAQPPERATILAETPARRNAHRATKNGAAKDAKDAKDAKGSVKEEE